MYITSFLIFSVFLLYHLGLQLCPEEKTTRGIPVIWPESPPGNYIQSTPTCYNNDNEITRICVDDEWIPPANKLPPCLRNEKYYNLSTCPPGFHQISQNIIEYCYQINEPVSWDYPCLKGGGAMVLTDFTDEDILSLLDSLKSNNVSRYYWLPAKRNRIFSPMTWYVTGPKWGRLVEEIDILPIFTSIFKNCLLLDVESKTLIAETCTAKHPTLCFYINSVYYPGKCPKNYHAIRYMPDHGVCFGIEHSETPLSFDDFHKNQCETPMGSSDESDITRYIFKKVAETDQLPDNMWCWFDKFSLNLNPNTVSPKYDTTEEHIGPIFYVAINNIGTLSLIDSTSHIQQSCMACQAEVNYENAELILEYNEKQNLILLTIYYPSGLWKYDISDRGIQCFSDAKGLVKVIDIQDLPVVEIQGQSYANSSDELIEEKVTYALNLVTNSSAQYWCEGHTKNFSLVTTDRIVVKPNGNNVDVFALVIKVYNVSSDTLQNNLQSATNELCENIQNVFNADVVLMMEVLEYTTDYLMILLHVHVAKERFSNEDVKDVVTLYYKLKEIAETELDSYGYTFVNITSSVYCLPTTSEDDAFYLDWELTQISHITAPMQFCLQENGLPVKRLCNGSYLLGGFWGDVEGSCDKSYMPSTTTKFLYMFVKGQISENYTSRFLVDGLGFALSNTDIIIPADIYYLSMSLQHVLTLAHNNETDIELGDIDNIAWVMSKITVFNDDYLRLAQTLNSTNVILDAMNQITEIIALNNEMVPVSRGNLNNNLVKSLRQSVQPQFIIQISYPYINNISGIAVVRKSHLDSFTDMEIVPLYSNTSLSTIISMKNLEIATWIPERVIQNLEKNYYNQNKSSEVNDKDVCIILSIFHSNSVFQDLNSNDYKVNSRIVGISIPGFITTLGSPVPLVYKDLKNTSTNHEKYCGYWEFNANKYTKIPGYWSNRGCYLKMSRNNLTICECYHLTHFGQLIDIGHRQNEDDCYTISKHSKRLNIISLIGSSLSLIGILGIWITATVFHKWRKKAGTKLLLHLSISIALPLIFLILFNLGYSLFEESGSNMTLRGREITCIAIGALLHYSVLASFMWMLITAVLQFVRYVRVLGARRPSRFIIKFTVVGWGAPIIPVMIVLCIDKHNYIPDLIKNSDSPICYPSGIYLILSVVVPIGIILFTNIILYVLVILAISKGPDGKLRSTDIDLLSAQFRLSIFLFFLLGLTWIFGIFSFSKNYIWSYLFCLTSTLQGFVLFIYFIIIDPDTRSLWRSLMKPQNTSIKSRESVTSISSG